MKRTPLSIAVLLLLALPSAAQQPAQPEAFARAQQLLQQVGREKAALETEMTQVLAERASLVREVEGLRKALDTAERDDAQEARVRNALESRIADTSRANAGMKLELATATDRIAALERELATREATAEKLTTALTSQTRKTNDTLEKSRALVELVHHLMEQLARRRGVLTTWLEREPLTGIGEVDVENTLQAARTRLLEIDVPVPVDAGIE